jgi:hypothetical protein
VKKETGTADSNSFNQSFYHLNSLLFFSQPQQIFNFHPGSGFGTSFNSNIISINCLALYFQAAFA